MKKKVIPFLLMFICLAATSCNSDNELQPTRMNGRPSSIKSNSDNGKKIFFFYQDNRLSKIKDVSESDFSYLFNFNYENDELSSVSGMPEDKNVADGRGYTRFRKEDGNKIVIETLGEPDFNIFRKELELDENNVPVKITDVGIFSHTLPDGELTKTGEGQYYALFTYSQATKSLTRLVVYDKISSKEVAAYDYEYDNNIGAISQMGLPLWYYAYRAYSYRDSRSSFYRIFLNYSNNLIKENVAKSDDTPEQSTYNYIYQYSKENIPVSMRNDEYDTDNALITY